MSSRLVAQLFRVVPALGVLPTYTWRDARADLVAGLTVAAVAVPQAMAYAMVAGLPPEVGLYTAIVMTGVGALFDGSRQLVNGPTNATSIAVLSAIAFVQGDAARYEAAVLLGLLVGAIQLVIAFARLGDLTRYISHSVVVGFTLGAGALLVLDQVKNLLGLTPVGDPHDHFLLRWVETLLRGGPVHAETAAVGLGSIALVVGLRWLKGRLGWPLFPELLLVVTLMAAATWALELDGRGVKVVGEIPPRLPAFEVPNLDPTLASDLSSSALAIALLGLLEALAMAKAIAARTRQRLDFNQQVLSEGVANFAGALFQGFPGSGSLTRSAINHQAGARSQWAAIVSALAVAAIVVLFAPYARYIPKAALAGILFVAAFRMVDWEALRYHVRATRFDAVIVFATAFSAVAVSVEFCILIGVVLSFLLAVPRAGQVVLTEFVVTPDGGIHERLDTDHACPRILVFGIEGEMFFGAGPALETVFDDLEARLDAQTRVLILRMKRVRNPDAVGLHQLEHFIERVERQGVQVLLCGVRPETAEIIARTGIPKHIPDSQIFREQRVRTTSTLMAIRAAYDLLDATCDACPRGDIPTDELPLHYHV